MIPPGFRVPGALSGCLSQPSLPYHLHIFVSSTKLHFLSGTSLVHVLGGGGERCGGMMIYIILPDLPSGLSRQIVLLQPACRNLSSTSPLFPGDFASWCRSKVSPSTAPVPLSLSYKSISIPLCHLLTLPGTSQPSHLPRIQSGQQQPNRRFTRINEKPG